MYLHSFPPLRIIKVTVTLVRPCTRHCIFYVLAFRCYTHVRLLEPVGYLTTPNLFAYAHFKRRFHEAPRLIGQKFP